MKLVHLEIDHFGTLAGFKYDLTDGVNVILQGNGWGKSTLAAFIKAMLYGLPATRKPLEENDRAHYTPWQGGKFGGSLTFEQNGKKYRIERFFGKKESEDTFVLYDLENNRVCDDFGAIPGETLFGINAEGFEKSIFLSQREINRGIPAKQNLNDSMNAKISRLSDAVHDLADFDNAAAILDKRRKYYQLKGDRGHIADLNREIIEKTREVGLTEQKAAQLAELDGQIAVLEEGRLADLSAQVEADKRLSEAAGTREMRAHMIALNQMLDRLSVKENEWNARLDKIGGELPTEDELKRTQADLDTLRTAEGDAKRAVMTDAEAERLSVLEPICRPYTEEDGRQKLAQLREQDASRLRLGGEIASIKSSVEGVFAERKASLRKKFPEEIPPTEVFDRLYDLLPENAKKSKIADAAVKKTPVLPILIAIACVLAAGGGVFLGIRQWIVGFVCIALGVGALVACRVICVKRLAAREASLTAAWNESLERWSIRPDRTRESIFSWQQDAGELTRVLKDEADMLSRREEIVAQVKVIEDEMIRDLPESDAPWADLTERLHALEDGVREYTVLTDRKEKLASEKRVAEKTAHEKRETLAATFRKYRLSGEDPESDMTSLVLSCREILSVRRDYEGDRAAMEQYAKSNALEPVRQDTLPEDTYDEAAEAAEALRAKIREIDAELTKLRISADPLRAETELLDERRGELALLTEQKAKEEKDLETVTLASDFLARAKENLTLRYLHRMQNSLRTYLAQLSGRSGLSLEMTPELDVRIREGATSYEVGYYSAGWQDLIRFCMRLSLCDALFDGECPPIILDDPFVNLDDRVQTDARAMLEEIGHKHQILYLTCHSSRK